MASWLAPLGQKIVICAAVEQMSSRNEKNLFLSINSWALCVLWVRAGICGSTYTVWAFRFWRSLPKKGICNQIHNNQKRGSSHMVFLHWNPLMFSLAHPLSPASSPSPSHLHHLSSPPFHLHLSPSYNVFISWYSFRHQTAKLNIQIGKYNWQI